MKTENPQQDLRGKSEVLIALAVQESETVEQPPSTEELVNFFENSRNFSKQRQEQILAYVDSNPEAYTRWIKHGKAAIQTKSAPFMFWISPYAMATYILLLMIGVGLFWRGQAFELNHAIDQGYEVAAFGDDPENFRQTMTSLNTALQQTIRPFSFSQAGEPSHLAQAFTLGLQHDWQALSQEPSESNPLINERQEDYQLGRWHTLLWIISQQNKVMPSDFWQEQLETLNYLQTHYAELEKETAIAEVRAIILQLERMQPILKQLAGNGLVVKSYRQLEETLAALRFSLISDL